MADPRSIHISHLSTGLVILDAVGSDPRLARWPQLHVARAELLRRLRGL